VRHHKKNARVQFWSTKAIAKRHRLRAESRLPESKPVQVTRSLTTGLKPGVVGVIGWQAAPATAPAWLTKIIERNASKSAKRARYERMIKRHAQRT
jgi:hypothetical protein